MENSVKSLLYLGVCLSAWSITTADETSAPAAQDVHWVSLDFKTILRWTAEPSDHRYTVYYAENHGDWVESRDCIRISESECDLTDHIKALDRTFSADIRTEPEDYDNDVDDYPHTYSPQFNPYKESNISAADFAVEALDNGKVMVNITDPLTGLHDRGRQLSIRDIFKNNLKYKTSYYKSGSTGKRDFIADSSQAEVPDLDVGDSYCFMVAAFFPTRPKATQQGAWSKQLCTKGQWNILQDLSVGTWVGIVFVLLAVLIAIIVVSVLCCRHSRQRNKTFQTAQSSSPI
ncbi:tissue factor-like [Pholidichthys leucotaenia]